MAIILRRSHGAALESHLKGAARRWLASNGYYPFEEVTTSWGIVDLMGIRVNIDRVLQRVRAGHREVVGDFRSVLVLLSIPTEKSRRSVSIADLNQKYAELMGAPVIGRIIERLTRKRMVGINASGGLFRIIDSLPIHDELVCIELKLNRIDEVLTQARRHRVAATGSFVGLPSPLAEKVAVSSRKGEFQSAGVGLLSVSLEGCAILIPPGSTDKERDAAHGIALAEKGWSEILKAIKH